MRHLKAGRRLSRTTEHRLALMRNLITSLMEHERVETTQAKAKEARFLLASTSEVYGDPLIHPQNESYWGNVNPIGLRSMYEEAKRFAEAAAQALAELAASIHHCAKSLLAIIDDIEDREAAAGDPEPALEGLVAVGHAAHRDHLGLVALRFELLAQQRLQLAARVARPGDALPVAQRQLLEELQRVADGRDDLQRFAGRELPGAFQLTQVQSIDVFHHEIWDPQVGADVEYGDDVRMA